MKIFGNNAPTVNSYSSSEISQIADRTEKILELDKYNQNLLSRSYIGTFVMSVIFILAGLFFMLAGGTGSSSIYGAILLIGGFLMIGLRTIALHLQMIQTLVHKLTQK